MKIRTQLLGIAGLLLLLSLGNTIPSRYLLSQIRGYDALINYSGVVRGTSQRVIKLVLAGRPEAEHTLSVDRILLGLLDGDEGLGIPKPDDPSVISKTREEQVQWEELKRQIARFKAGEIGPDELVDESERFFDTTNRQVFATSSLASDRFEAMESLDSLLMVLNLLVIIGVVLISRRISTTLSEAVGTLVQSASEIAATVEQQEQVTVHQASSINETVTTMDELEASFKQATDQAENTAEIARNALELTELGNRAVDNTITGMGSLKDRVNEVVQQILTLSEQIGQIGEITSTVADLASRTNMLALNASVEAARAGGEQGKGFSVVASEIRKLADESRRSTERIDALVRDLQKATNSTVMATEEGTKTVDRTSEIAGEAATAFSQLAASMNTTYESTQQAILSVRQQLAAAGQVTEAMASLNSAAEETAQGMATAKVGVERLRDMANRLESLT